MITPTGDERARGSREGFGLVTTGVVVAEVWRGRQGQLARLLQAVDVRAVDAVLGRAAGLLLGAAGTSNAVDASVVAVAATGDRILTGDPDDLRRLVEASGRQIRVVAC